MKPFLVMMVLCVACAAAQARSLHVAGTVGYLSEWAIDGEVAETESDDSKELFGLLTWKHVGLCSVSGSQEKQAEIRMRFFNSGPLSQVHAIISFEGGQCLYTGGFSGSSNGYMDCPESKGVPISISVK